MSPYLFLLCAKGLSTLMRQVESSDRFKWVSLASGKIKLTHLLFADDCVFFGRAKLVEWKTLQNILANYEKASGQCLNSQKTTIFFSSNTSMANRTSIRNSVGANEYNHYEKYLGLPTMVGKS